MMSTGTLLFQVHKPFGTCIGNAAIGFVLTGHGCPALFSYILASLPGVEFYPYYSRDILLE